MTLECQSTAWKLVWICRFCGTRHTGERGIPDDDEIRALRFSVALALSHHAHCSPGCGRYLCRSDIDWDWQPDE